MLKDDGLDRENAPVKHGITKADHDAIRDAYFESKAQRQRNVDAMFSQFLAMVEARD
ncbi:MAG: hypothetical protein M3Y27_02315 [Acidobacteriota bacterium]|nr:hypothetical protein [Acidobacteriota bacterium]